jgi:hypothetical protein
MNKQPKFKINDPKSKEEKLIVELIKDLDATTYAFMKLNHSGNITTEMFVILRDASIGYSGAMVRDLAKLLASKEQVIPFLKEAKRIYMAYINELMRTL